MQLDLSDQTDDVEVTEVSGGGVWVTVGGFPVELCRAQFMNLFAACAAFEAARHPRKSGDKGEKPTASGVEGLIDFACYGRWEC